MVLRASLYAKGVQIWCAPTVDDRERWSTTMRHIAVEGRCFVVSACQFTVWSDCPDDYDTGFGDDPDTVLIKGGSCIVGPDGEFLALPDHETETVLVADIDLGEIAKGKYDLDVVGHYARPDVFQLQVNEAPQHAVVRTKWDTGQPENEK